MQTELHHLQILHIMAKVFRRGMKEEVQLDKEAVERVFPCLDQLLLLHHAFFAALKERRQSSAQPQGHRNYLIRTVGDILLQQVSRGSGTTSVTFVASGCIINKLSCSFQMRMEKKRSGFMETSAAVTMKRSAFSRISSNTTKDFRVSLRYFKNVFLSTRTLAARRQKA